MPFATIQKIYNFHYENRKTNVLLLEFMLKLKWDHTNTHTYLKEKKNELDEQFALNSANKFVVGDGSGSCDGAQKILSDS